MQDRAEEFDGRISTGWTREQRGTFRSSARAAGNRRDVAVRRVTRYSPLYQRFKVSKVLLARIRILPTTLTQPDTPSPVVFSDFNLLSTKPRGCYFFDDARNQGKYQLSFQHDNGETKTSNAIITGLKELLPAIVAKRSSKSSTDSSML